MINKINVDGVDHEIVSISAEEKIQNLQTNKQDLITDIDTIRQGAAKGATALQSYTEEYKGTVTGVKINGTTKNPSNGVVDLGTVITGHQNISGKQDTLVSGTNIKTINGTSILGSGNIVISAYSEVNHGTSDTIFTLTPNTFHVWDKVSALTLTFGSETSGVANKYLFQFTSGSTPTTLTLPDSIKFNSDFTVESNKIYQISILNGLGTVMSWERTIKIITFKIDETEYQAEEGMTWEEWVNSEYNTKEYLIFDGYDGIYIFDTIDPEFGGVVCSRISGHVTLLSTITDQSYYVGYPPA